MAGRKPKKDALKTTRDYSAIGLLGQRSPAKPTNVAVCHRIVHKPVTDLIAGRITPLHTLTHTVPIQFPYSYVAALTVGNQLKTECQVKNKKRAHQVRPFLLMSSYNQITNCTLLTVNPQNHVGPGARLIRSIDTHTLQTSIARGVQS